MAASIFNLLMFMHLSTFFASGLEVKSKICGADHIAYSNLYGHEFFYLNGNLVDKVLFCKALQLHYADHCVFEGYSGTDYCGLDLSSVDLSLGGGRKLLQGPPKEDEKADQRPKGKRRANAHAVLEKDLNSMDSTSPLEMSIHSPPEKVPPSPLRVPASPSRFSMSPQLNRIGSVHLTMTQVTRATRNFSSALQIGEGGFGIVYKAQLDSGQVVAIKRAKKANTEDSPIACVPEHSEHFENLRTEFSSEVELLAKIDHRNLVKLLGYVDKGNERLIITEYVPNGSLREHLDGQRGRILDFNQRLEIAIDVAHGLTYLHLYAEKQIIHRDVKSSNILLTESMRAKVADFGFARLGPMDSDQTHISTKVKGTVGYLDPEYMKTYQLTPKSDVYSFGILLIEILTGRRPVELRRPVEERVTLRWGCATADDGSSTAFHKYNEGHAVQLVDPAMEEVVDAEVLVKIFALAFQCAAPVRNDRPDMKSVGEQLWAIRADYLKSSRKV
ncbi:hypothetical protein COLO4_15567 [Corchorus olitorius]|uniref:non-specific serine/threonine protein kinase n=1 Tax=Corchorus olitorius TaxID=93759 RepID=A0A1R3JMA2_9ROSI|nr:hypothetical protein COLO4_15567 [Corchorus olitorius]